ncbi:G-type lectin S-receptor-like serine/threonine-protein kinase At1g61370 isoform X1 [Syzygium oleosum]|uniref:G-type lectin S-receptor-like serine/threonine-protein kinase At1g61370 isoform X1 n=1 Tax=Syzygium oleosum TaxID=219896 RepID=UPI0024B949F6|nr:G-type lectin S-receptor-like serine/threonine-protein kinase At1g61370 isoform X1 [Syzygium oleosum]
MPLMICWCSCLVFFILLQASQIASGVVYNITTSEPLFPNQTLVSSGHIFELGFFTPNGSENQYVGIWYKNFTPSKVVWVANRDLPLMYTDQSAKLTIGSDGNLKLVDGQQNIVWSTNASGRSDYTSAALLDSGNFVLQDANYSEIWGSFDDLTDTLLPGMKMGVNARTGQKHYLISWRSDSDPSPGSFLTGITSETPPQTFTWNGSTPYWRGGQWDKSKFIGIQNMDQSYSSAVNVQQDIQKGTTYLSIDYKSSFFVYIFVSPGGSLKIMEWDDGAKVWLTDQAAPNNTCEIYGTCGPFGVCNSMNLPICRCLNGFVPKSNEEWKSGNWTGGCVRETELNCQKDTSTLASTIVKKDAFWQMSRMKLPDSEDYLSDIGDQEGCLSWCLSNCSCLAYSYVSTIGCMVWNKEDLIDLEEFSTAGEDLFVRVAHVKKGGSPQKAVIISLSTVAGIMFFAVFVFGLCKWRAKKRGNFRKTSRPLDSVDKPEKPGELLQGNAWKEQLKQDDALELTLFSFDSILLATNKFSTTSKLGQGGFGTVYKGKMDDGKEVAVKRLSSSSAQGVQEFKNEIVLISKLQHRNLVKLIGCCTEGDEKILVYEYLPNKSLDTFLFDSRKKAELDWGKRFQIIEGIARGLLYLHRDSCLRVIHRDLKVSNILLDEKMNPKISDFGLARMFEGTQVLVNTHKIVGTLGYMSPEYAMGGIFSERSDVYSFGVLLLEIISGRKNTTLYDQGYLNLLSYAWQLWSEGKALDLMDEAIAVSFPLEVTRCIHVGLLCVQDHTMDRPNMTNVVLMLSGESDPPQPRQPIFTFQTEMPNRSIPSQQESIWSVNTVTNTMFEGR